MADNVEDGGIHKYRRQWQAFRSRRNLIAVLLVAEFLGFLPIVALVASVERRLFSADKMFFPAALLWGALYIFTASRLRNFPCPRCGRNFFGGFFATPETVLGGIAQIVGCVDMPGSRRISTRITDNPEVVTGTSCKARLRSCSMANYIATPKRRSKRAMCSVWTAQDRCRAESQYWLSTL
jgi:hypothetical protein